MLDKLHGQIDDVALRKLYLPGQLDAHKDAVSLFKRYSDGGDNAKLKSWAKSTLPTLEHHLQMAEGLENGR